MRDEVSSAVDFLTKLLKLGNVESDQLDTFNQSLKRLLCEHYRDHWFPEKPFKGSGYRCLRINHKMEPIIVQAASECGLVSSRLEKLLPNELTLWIDPREVSYRIGEDGSVGMIYSADRGTDNSRSQNSNNNGSRSSSESESPCSTPPKCHSPQQFQTVSYEAPVDFTTQSCKGQFQRPVDNMNLKRLAAYVYS